MRNLVVQNKHFEDRLLHVKHKLEGITFFNLNLKKKKKNYEVLIIAMYTRARAVCTEPIHLEVNTCKVHLIFLLCFN